MKLIHSGSIYFSLLLLGLSSIASAEKAKRLPWAFEYMTNIACHDIPGMSGHQSNFGPSLKGVGVRWSRDELVQWVTDARVLKPDTLMPPYGTHQALEKVNPARSALSADQIKDIVDALQTWR
jgi:hypothetical protein